MKKQIVWILILGLLISNVTVQAANIKIVKDGKTMTYTDKQLKVNLNDKKINIDKTPGILIDGYALLPYEDVFTKSSLKVASSYSKATKNLTLKHNGHTVKLKVNSKTAYVDGIKKTMAVSPKSITYKSNNVTKILVPSRFVAESLGLTYGWNSSLSTVGIRSLQGLPIQYGGKTYQYTKKYTNIVVNGKKVNTKMPGIIIDNMNLIPANSVYQKSAIKADYKYDSKKKVLTLKRGTNTVILTMGSKTATVNGKKKTMTTAPQLVKNLELGSSYVMVPGEFVTQALGCTYVWDNATATASITAKAIAKPNPDSKPDMKPDTKPDPKPDPDTKPDPEKPPVVPEKPPVVPDKPTTEEPPFTPPTTENPVDEMKAMWISYLEFGSGAKAEVKFKAMIDKMYDRCVDLGMNAVIVQVRPFSDALYPSNYFPWSKYISGTQGKDPGYDPLKYMVEEAHKRGLEFHAWLNPYRVTMASSGGTDYNQLASQSPARKWHESTDNQVQRNVLEYANQLYYNPSKKEVQTLIINGVKEIVQNYDVDGIHFDDYFYPTFSSSNVNSAFDAPEYKQYAEDAKKEGKMPMTIANWRRDNINTLVKDLYAAIKKLDKNVEFGISPAGNINNLTNDLQHYVDIKKWLSNPGYIDYICPQIYWGFDNGVYSYDKVMDQWIDINSSDIVKLYVGLAVYKAGSSLTTEWKNNTDILKRQVEYARDSKASDGFMFFRYDSFNINATQAEVENLLPLLK